MQTAALTAQNQNTPPMSEYSSELRSVGHHFVVGLEGTRLTPRESRLLNELRPAGIILFANNIDKGEPHWEGKLRDLILAAKEGADNPELLVSIDHEGGKVHRLPPPITRFPAAHHWRESVTGVAEAMAVELLQLGVTLSFCPVLDIHSEPTNPVIGHRAFGSDPDEVAELGERFYKAQEAFGVLACGKHFPGHGATTTDSHYTLPVLDLPLEALRARELVPFKRAIASGIGALMSAHVLYPQLDPKVPATLSRRILTELLRDELSFSGVVFTDALDMRALEKMETPLAETFISAGGDILLVAKPLPWRSPTTMPVVHGCEMALEILRSLDSKHGDVRAVELSQKRVEEYVIRGIKLREAASLRPPSLTVVARQELAMILQGRA